jgi:hypothetical protein
MEANKMSVNIAVPIEVGFVRYSSGRIESTKMTEYEMAEFEAAVSDIFGFGKLNEAYTHG